MNAKVQPLQPVGAGTSGTWHRQLQVVGAEGAEGRAQSFSTQAVSAETTANGAGSMDTATNE